METWLQNEILTGFQKLLCLGLERQPAAEVLPGTVRAWIEALTSRLSWDEVRDAPRIRKAFVTITATRRSWPTPADLIEVLPPPKGQPRLERPTGIPETVEAREARLQKLLYGEEL